MTKLILSIIQLVVDLIEKACNGDNEALQKICDIAPENMRIEIIAKVQDEMDLRKFGPRVEKS